MHLRLAGWEICLWWPQSICCCTCLMCHFELHMLEKEKKGEKNVCATRRKAVTNYLSAGQAVSVKGLLLSWASCLKKALKNQKATLLRGPSLRPTGLPYLPGLPACLPVHNLAACLFLLLFWASPRQILNIPRLTWARQRQFWQPPACR